MTQTFHLPFPPTANTIWRRYGKTIALSGPYQKWKNEAGMVLMTLRPKSVVGPVWLRIALRRSDKRKWDIDNRVKPLIDLLVSHLVIEEDCSEIVKGITVHVDNEMDCGARVTVIPFDAAEAA